MNPTPTPADGSVRAGPGSPEPAPAGGASPPEGLLLRIQRGPGSRADDSLHLGKGLAMTEAAAEHSTGQPSFRDPGLPEISVVMPCLNEAETLARCVEK